MKIPNPKKDELYFLPLGGSGEIGMNFNLYGYKGKWLIVDCGVTFGDNIHGSIDVAMPDIVSIENEKEKLCGLLLTHAHEDHIGAVHHLWPYLKCPVYATEFAAEILKRKLSEVGLEDEVEINIIDINSKLTIEKFKIEVISMTHSILEPVSLIIETEVGKIFHTGDWKIDYNPQMGKGLEKTKLIELANQNILAMVCDSTNVFETGYSGSEEDVISSLTKIINSSKNRVFVTTFASNIVRLRTISKIAITAGRRVALVGQSMWRMVDAAKQCGYLHDLPSFISEKDVGLFPKNKILIICTGSQGEPRAALSRITNGIHKDVNISEGDCIVFSSRVIPGNEISIFNLQNKLSDLGVEIIESSKDNLVHVSGHPSRNELSDMYSWVKPNTLIAVHGENRHINEHVKYAKEQQIPNALSARNGTIIQLGPGDPRYIGEVESGRLVLDGNDIISRDSEVFKLRHKMMYNGAIYVVLVMDKSFNLLHSPSIMLEGVAEVINEDDPIIKTKQFIISEIDKYKKARGFSKEYIENTITDFVKKFIRQEYSKRPIVKVEVIVNKK
ncbi:MAG: hypothetical protein CMJ14_05350 [Pelagibacterales bacterium]|nr:hypothetical protein [Pelagibacterales bacterium]|tara:strand:+ start:1 stop:1674 length:1674 start_codon:yes stop_codon:yes gene_type:complete